MSNFLLLIVGVSVSVSVAITASRVRRDGHVRVGHSQCSTVLEVLLLEGHCRLGARLGRVVRLRLTILGLLLQRKLLRRKRSVLLDGGQGRRAPSRTVLLLVVFVVVLVFVFLFRRFQSGRRIGMRWRGQRGRGHDRTSFTIVKDKST